MSLRFAGPSAPGRWRPVVARLLREWADRIEHPTVLGHRRGSVVTIPHRWR